MSSEPWKVGTDLSSQAQGTKPPREKQKVAPITAPVRNQKWSAQEDLAKKKKEKRKKKKKEGEKKKQHCS